MTKALPVEMNMINRVFAAHDAGVWAQMIHPKSGQPMVMMTPTFTLWALYRARLHVTDEQVRKLLPEVQKALRMLHGDRSLVVRYQDGILEVPSQSPSVLELGEKGLANLGEYDALVGVNYGWPKPTKVVLNLADGQTGHILVAGTTRLAGKTSLKRVMISTLALNTSPERLHFVMIDLKGVGLSPFRSLPHVRGWSSNHEEAGNLIRGVAEELQRRVDGELLNEPRLVLVVDELYDLLAFGSLTELFRRAFPSIATRGAEMGVHLLLGAQNPAKRDLGAQLRSQMGTKLIGHVEDAAVAHALTGRSGTGAETLPGKGSFLLIDGGRPALRVQSYWMANVGTMVDRICEKWGDVRLPQIKGASAKRRKFSRRDWQDDLEKARPVFETYWQWVPGSAGAGGKLATGGKKAIIEAMFGVGADTGGSNSKKADEVIAALEGEIVYGQQAR